MSAAGADPAPAIVAPAIPLGPKIHFATNSYDYGRQVAGTRINYTFAFTNIGDQVLEVPSAQGSCHCTTAGDWSKRVEPGQAGVIPVTFDSSGFSGQMTRTVTVTCNDKTQPTVVLQLTGTIWKPIEVSPAMAYFTVPPDAASAPSTVIRIVSNLELPLTVFPPESNSPNFTAVLKTNEPGKSFEVVITAVPPFASGSVQGQIVLKTSSTATPVISIPAMAHIQPAITVTPPQISLPAPPFAAPVTNTLTIQNAGTNVLKLSDAAVNAKDVAVQISEPQPGRLFNVTLVFPRGFDPAAGPPIEFSVKSSHPKYPVIRAPINLAPRQVLVGPPTGQSVLSPPGTKP